MDRRVEAAIQLMKSDRPRCSSVTEIARTVGLSPWHFTHLFRTATSKSPSKYLQEIRMERARAMLETTTLGLKEIVYDVGLTDRSHFSREFKKLHGLTPREFIAQRRTYLAGPSSKIHRVPVSATEQQESPHFRHRS